ALLEMLGLDHEIAEPRAGRDDDLHRVGRLLLGLRDQALERGDARLRLGLARARALAHPFELLRDRALARLLLAALLLEALLLLLEPARIIAVERQALAAIDLEDPFGDVVEEIAVVGDRHHGAGIVLEEALE